MVSRWHYAGAAGVVFLTEVGIALFLHDGIIRPYLGDSLAVVLVYLATRAATPLRHWPAIGVALSVALAVEVSQALRLLHWIGLGHSRLARVVLGGQFDPADFVAYGAGAGLILLGSACWRAARRRDGRPA